jgi:regulatory protein
MNSSDAGAAARPVDSDRVAPVIYLFGKAQVTAPTVVHAHVEAGRVTASEGSPLQETARAASLDSNQRTAETFEPISNSSMYALGRRAMSSQEMRDYLGGHDFGSVEIDTEIERLERVALLDDVLLAQELAENLRRRKGLGRSALTAELKRRQLSPSAIAEALEDGEEHDELQQAIALAMKRAPQLRALDATTARRRLGDFLMRKGYSGQVVSKAVQAALVPASSSGPTFR